MRTSRSDFIALFLFLTFTFLLLSNAYVGRIFAQGDESFLKIEPIGHVLAEINKNYVEEPDLDKVVEGALVGMMNRLDKHSAYISALDYRQLQDDTQGEFDGIGVTIKLDDDQNIVIMQPLEGSPAAKAGVQQGDLIYKIDGTTTTGMSLADAANRIKGPRGTTVHLTLVRRHNGDQQAEIVELDIKRDKVPLFSISEARMLDKGIAYLRIRDFKTTTAKETADKIHDLEKQGMKALVLDLRWNPGGLLTASKEACELFLPKNKLVTYTKGRKAGTGSPTENMKLFTEREPVIPENLPIAVLVSDSTASSAEIVTGALQYWSRAIIIGEKTYGKGSVQTIIPLQRPEGSALRLTTALYYTPAEVTIDNQGIKPDVEVPMDKKEQAELLNQMYESFKDDLSKLNQQNHGSVTGNAPAEGLIDDKPLQKAVEILTENAVFQNLLAKYHKDPRETQVAATGETSDESRAEGLEALVEQ
ncbi:MAG: S41 family peptidase [Candidatus Hydrogenedentes bacterium]|nr:S41 family peptidase [Candidatus Hydrogenedentota bacterium]